MKIETDWKTALIILLITSLLLIGVYYYRDFTSERVISRMELRIRQTQTVLGQLQFPRNVADALSQIGWQVQETKLDKM